MNASAIGRKLKAAENFIAADSAQGSFTLNTWRDDASLNRTSAWPLKHCTGLWRRRVDQPAGLVIFEFEIAADAAAFRVATATLPGMIPCR